MKIVIDIPEKVKQTFDDAKDEDLYGNYYDYNSLIGKAIKNGIPLPKGHGRLIDADSMWNAYHDLDYDFYEAFDLADTIIESDKEQKS